MDLDSIHTNLVVAAVGIVIGSGVTIYGSQAQYKRMREEVQNERDRLAQGLLDHEQDQFTKLLVDFYAFGLVQARRSFSVTLSCSALGGLVLIVGVALAIFTADTNGPQYASITASVAGLLTTAIGTLFHRRADLALKHMESQTQLLRQDMKVERDAGLAVRLLGEVEDPALRAHLQAALILKFSAAKLPELGGVLKPVDSVSALGSNAALPQQ
ncbi:TRADD-N-associated membrane domain-containing protein [Streptomyces sp. NPDC004721]